MEPFGRFSLGKEDGSEPQEQEYPGDVDDFSEYEDPPYLSISIDGVRYDLLSTRWYPTLLPHQIEVMRVAFNETHGLSLPIQKLVQIDSGYLYYLEIDVYG
jgi:hypothetical protein